MSFKPEQQYLIFDFETYSEVDLKNVGSYVYANHPTTEILCASFRLGTRETLKTARVRTFAPKKEWNEDLTHLRTGRLLSSYIVDPNIIIVAHNAMFEQAITRFVLSRLLAKIYKTPVPYLIPHERFICTATLASVCALPRKLEDICLALKLPHQKDSEGHKLMLKWCKPKKPSKKDPSLRYIKNFERLVEYCERDILATTDVFLLLPPMIESERKLWVFDQVINFRGAMVDRDLVEKIQVMIKEEKRVMTNELRTITNDVIQTGGQGAVILKWLEDQDVFLPNLQKKTVDDAINEGLVVDDAKRVLELRQNLNKTSLKKYTAFLNHTSVDSIARFNLNFNATVHGRWGGSGIQMHNFPRGTLKMKDSDGSEIDLAPIAADLISIENADLETIRFLYEEPIEVFVSCLRTMIIARPGKELFVSDFNAIEARVLFWLAGHTEGMKAFIEKRKMYEELAQVIYNSPTIADVTKDERFVGKQAFLASGYGAGWKKFQTTCKDLGEEIETSVAKKAINSYRELHSPVVKLWYALEKAAITAVLNPKNTVKINNTEWFMKGRWLNCKLPSGRCLKYYGPQVKEERTPWGEMKKVLYHWTVDSKTKKWVFGKTWGGVLTQNCVGGISRDLLAASMIRQEQAGYYVILTVHDEVIAERNIGEGSIEEFNFLMAQIPAWAKGCPVSAEGFQGFRYHK